MRGHLFSIIGVGLFWAGLVWSQPHPLAAVGRLESPDKSGCSAVLVAPQTVLTAAHCANNFSTSYVFHSAAYPGTPGVSVAVEALAPHPVFLLGLGGRRSQLRVDLALVRLQTSIDPDQALPISVGAAPDPGEVFLVASYPGAVGARPRERQCKSFALTSGVLSLGCPVRGGESGAPVLRRTASGLEIAAILTARTNEGVQPIGLAVAPALHLETLNDALNVAEPLSSDGS